MEGNFKISNEKVDLVTDLWKGLFKPIIFMKMGLSCDDYSRKCRNRQKSNTINLYQNYVEILENFDLIVIHFG